MAEKRFDPEDPMALTGAVLPLSEKESVAAEEEMARTIVEEFALLGRDDEEILKLFRNPFYRFPHQVYRARGEKYVRNLIRKTRGDGSGL